MQDKVRADVALVERGLAGSREKAQALIMEGLVYVREVRVAKPSILIAPKDELLVREGGLRYVSRGALKLKKGLAVFHVDPKGRVAIDIGASTGGFTDVLLRSGASHVYAIDVGYGQLDWKIRSDPHVTVMERINARYLRPEDFEMRPELVVMDVSFISITKILPAAAAVLDGNGEIITLIKPQFEVGKGRVGRKGVVREAQMHVDVLHQICLYATDQMGWRVQALTYSPIRGPEGNIEFLAHLLPSDPCVVEKNAVSSVTIETIVQEAHEAFV